MLRLLLNRRFLIAVAVVGGLLAVALWPSTTIVDVAAIGRGPLMVTIDEEGTTRVRERYVISAPVAGRVLRIELEPGDPVKKGQVVAQVRAEAAPLLDPRARAEGQAAVESARAALGQARAEEQRTKSVVQLAQRELQRARTLEKDGLITGQQVDQRESELKTAEDAASSATYAIRVAEAEIQRAQSRLTPSAPDQAGRVFSVTSPAGGVILKRLRESESVVPAGEALVEIGNPQLLEIVSDLLSTDAVRVKPGAKALIEQWGGEEALDARVRRVEPSGFTKISALGVEEQRVNVVLDFAEPGAAMAALGDGYRVEVRVVTWEHPNVLKVPAGALFREGDAWAVYKVEGDRIRKTIVTIGQQTGQEAELLSGLQEGERVVLHPGDSLAEGSRVEARR
jgi:HlyD family secretion protein